MLHKGSPVQVDRSLSHGDINGTITTQWSAEKQLQHKMRNSLQPILDIIHLSTGNRIDMQRGFGEILEDENHVKLLETPLDALKGCDFDV